jgi:hypothetical protein
VLYPPYSLLVLRQLKVILPYLLDKQMVRKEAKRTISVSYSISCNPLVQRVPLRTPRDVQS